MNSSAIIVEFFHTCRMYITYTNGYNSSTNIDNTTHFKYCCSNWKARKLFKFDYWKHTLSCEFLDSTMFLHKSWYMIDHRMDVGGYISITRAYPSKRCEQLHSSVGRNIRRIHSKYSNKLKKGKYCTYMFKVEERGGGRLFENCGFWGGGAL